MKIEIQLFGAFRDFEPAALVALELPADAVVGDVRAALERHAVARWPRFQPALLQRSALASTSSVLRDHEPLPADGRMAVLPPVSGG
ncbi:MAG TPA: thiamine biosynthesis protein ThiS [Xanthomonadaceae bacterium]|nr:thiamine biosynthesis protein ThiS [Xanthomonadaceae bacterium]